MFSIEHNINQCPFIKNNLITQHERGSGRGYDTYGCTQCGAVGRRYSFSDTLMMAKRPKCPEPEPVAFTPVTIAIATSKGMDQFGFELGQQLQTVPSPEPRFAKDVWVFSQSRNQPVRLIAHEYNIVV